MICQKLFSLFRGNWFSFMKDASQNLIEPICLVGIIEIRFSCGDAGKRTQNQYLCIFRNKRFQALMRDMCIFHNQRMPGNCQALKFLLLDLDDKDVLVAEGSNKKKNGVDDEEDA